ncbi:MAG: PilZ domain-containing protein [Desulfobulbaceae bacterium]|nr:PilZ domain-containing protein [Desulfobulbaceae bacterium]
MKKLITGNPLYDQELERAPWEIEIEHYVRITSPDLIEKSLNVIKNDYLLLVLASLDGQRYGNTILVNFDQEILTIDKPNTFDENTVDTFRIYFKDILGEWSFFQVRTISECAFTLCSTYPDALYRLQRRQYHRVDLPEGTRAVFWEEDRLRDGGVVKDLSAVGMLICTGSTEEQFQANTVINEIAIALPFHPSARRKDAEERVVLPVIKKGRIVRSFKDSETNLIYHGVAFDKDDEEETELTRYVEVVKDGKPGKG